MTDILDIFDQPVPVKPVSELDAYKAARLALERLIARMPREDYLGWAIPLNTTRCETCGHRYTVPGAPLAHYESDKGTHYTSDPARFPTNYRSRPAEILHRPETVVPCCHRCSGTDPRDWQRTEH